MEQPTLPTCHWHPDRETRLACTVCDRPICTECMTTASVGQRCPECAKPSGRARVMTAQQAIAQAERTPFTKAVVGLCVGLWVLQYVTGGFGSPVFQLGAQANGLIAAGEYWRLLTAMFLHSPGLILHIVFNMLLLWILGRPVEREVGSAAFASLFFGAGLTGAAAYFFLAGARPAVGASGAVFGLFGAWLAAGLRNRNTLQGRLLLRQIGPLVLLNVGISFLPGIAWQAHFGGLAAGLLIAGVWGRVAGRGQTPRAVLGVTVALIAVMAVVLATLL